MGAVQWLPGQVSKSDCKATYLKTKCFAQEHNVVLKVWMSWVQQTKSIGIHPDAENANKN